MKLIPATVRKDIYKAFHPFAYEENTEFVYSNMTPRFGKHSNVPKNAFIVFMGIQAYLKEATEAWDEFFALPKDIAVAQYARIVNSTLGKSIDTEHLEQLHDVGYLPIEVRALPEGSLVPYGIPVYTIINTIPNFGWVTNMLETDMSSETWGMMTSATTAFAYRQRFEQEESLRALGLIKVMGHDFSYRGMMGRMAAAASGTGHAACFLGSDTLPVVPFVEDRYGDDCTEAPIIVSVDATEHSVATSYTMTIENSWAQYGEYRGNTPQEWLEIITGDITYEWDFENELRLLAEVVYVFILMTEVTPEGILSLVWDSFDFWGMVTKGLPVLKDTILRREGTVVVRPDSGDPVHILTGYTEEEVANSEVELEPHEIRGLVGVLADIFGTTEFHGLQLLDSHIGTIYGDSITLERQDQIIERTKAKGFVPSTVLGIGSFTYQYVTRDTHGTAVKATAVGLGEIPEAKAHFMPICKDPKTDASKKSAQGFLKVVKNGSDFELVQDVDVLELEGEDNQMKCIYREGQMLISTTLQEIRARIDANFE